MTHQQQLVGLLVAAAGLIAVAIGMSHSFRPPIGGYAEIPPKVL